MKRTKVIEARYDTQLKRQNEDNCTRIIEVSQTSRAIYKEEN
jgi:hypothetical protein